MYVKLFSSMMKSSVWVGTTKETKLVWVTLLMMADQDGVVESTIPGLAKEAEVSIEECEEVVTLLLAPDPYSKSPEYEGRRIEVVSGVGWQLLNHKKYRETQTARQKKDAARKRRTRADKRGHVPDVPPYPDTEADTEADTDPTQHPSPQKMADIGYVMRCVKALNLGLEDNETLNGEYNPVPAGGQHAVVTWEEDGIPVETAEATVREIASRYKPKPNSQQPYSLRYFDGPVRQAHENGPGAAQTRDILLEAMTDG